MKLLKGRLVFAAIFSVVFTTSSANEDIGCICPSEYITDYEDYPSSESTEDEPTEPPNPVEELIIQYTGFEMVCITWVPPTNVPTVDIEYTVEMKVVEDDTNLAYDIIEKTPEPYYVCKEAVPGCLYKVRITSKNEVGESTPVESEVFQIDIPEPCSAPGEGLDPGFTNISLRNFRSSKHEQQKGFGNYRSRKHEQQKEKGKAELNKYDAGEMMRGKRLNSLDNSSFATTIAKKISDKNKGKAELNKHDAGEMKWRKRLKAIDNATAEISIEKNHIEDFQMNEPSFATSIAKKISDKNEYRSEFQHFLQKFNKSKDFSYRGKDQSREISVENTSDKDYQSDEEILSKKKYDSQEFSDSEENWSFTEKIPEEYKSEFLYFLEQFNRSTDSDVTSYQNKNKSVKDKSEQSAILHNDNIDSKDHLQKDRKEDQLSIENVGYNIKEPSSDENKYKSEDLHFRRIVDDSKDISIPTAGEEKSDELFLAWTDEKILNENKYKLDYEDFTRIVDNSEESPKHYEDEIMWKKPEDDYSDENKYKLDYEDFTQIVDNSEEYPKYYGDEIIWKKPEDEDSDENKYKLDDEQFRQIVDNSEESPKHYGDEIIWKKTSNEEISIENLEKSLGIRTEDEDLAENHHAFNKSSVSKTVLNDTGKFSDQYVLEFLNFYKKLNKSDRLDGLSYRDKFFAINNDDKSIEGISKQLSSSNEDEDKSIEGISEQLSASNEDKVVENISSKKNIEENYHPYDMGQRKTFYSINDEKDIYEKIIPDDGRQSSISNEIQSRENFRFSQNSIFEDNFDKRQEFMQRRYKRSGTEIFDVSEKDYLDSYKSIDIFHLNHIKEPICNTSEILTWKTDLKMCSFGLMQKVNKFSVKRLLKSTSDCILTTRPTSCQLGHVSVLHKMLNFVIKTMKHHLKQRRYVSPDLVTFASHSDLNVSLVTGHSSQSDDGKFKTTFMQKTSLSEPFEHVTMDRIEIPRNTTINTPRKCILALDVKSMRRCSVKMFSYFKHQKQNNQPSLKNELSEVKRCVNNAIKSCPFWIHLEILHIYSLLLKFPIPSNYDFKISM